MIAKPTHPAPSAYAQSYINQVVEADLVKALQTSLEATLGLLNGLEPVKENHRYAEGKWTIKEVALHLVDAERIFTYRALRFSRGDATQLPGFEENAYVPQSNASARRLADILEELEAVRRSTSLLFKGMTSNMLDAEGVASGVLYTPRILGWFVVGHNVHHVRVLRERYLN